MIFKVLRFENESYILIALDVLINCMYQKLSSQSSSTSSYSESVPVSVLVCLNQSSLPALMDPTFLIR